MVRQCHVTAVVAAGMVIRKRIGMRSHWNAERFRVHVRRRVPVATLQRLTPVTRQTRITEHRMTRTMIDDLLSQSRPLLSTTQGQKSGAGGSECMQAQRDFVAICLSSELSAYGGPPGTRPESRLRLMRSTVTLVSWLYVSRECTTVLRSLYRIAPN